MKKDIDSNSIIGVFSFLALILNTYEQVRLVFDQETIIPSLFIESVGNSGIKFAGLFAMVVSLLGFFLADKVKHRLNYNGFLLKQGKNFTDNQELSYLLFIPTLFLFMVIPMGLYLYIAFGVINSNPFWTLLQIFSYSLFWGVVTLTFALFLLNIRENKIIKENREHFALVLKTTLERYDPLPSEDKKTKLLGTFGLFYKITYIEQGGKYYKVITSSDGIDLISTREINKDVYEKSLDQIDNILKTN